MTGQSNFNKQSMSSKSFLDDDEILSLAGIFENNSSSYIENQPVLGRGRNFYLTELIISKKWLLATFPSSD